MPRMSITESSGCDTRETILYGFITRTTFSTPGSTSSASMSIWRSSPIAPITVRSIPRDTWAPMPMPINLSDTASICSSGLPAFMIMIIYIHPLRHARRPKRMTYPAALVIVDTAQTRTTHTKNKTSQHGSWIRTQYLQLRRRRAQFLERLADRLLRRVAFFVDEKHIFPLAAPRGPRLDAGHGNTMFGERRQQVVQRARAIRRRHQERSLVAAALRHHLAPDHQKARRVVRFVFDITRDRAETVDIGRFTARNRGRIRLSRDPARRICVAAHRDALDTSEIFIQPLPTLGEGLLMRVHASYRTQSVDAAEEIMVYAQLHLADDLERRVEKHVERVRDHTLRGILHGHHTVVASACFDIAKALVDGVVRHRAHRMPEVLERRHLRDRTLGPEIGDAQQQHEHKAEVLRRVIARNQGPLGGEEMARLFREIMSACLALVLLLCFVFLGFVGLFTQVAALKHFGHSVSTVAHNAIDEVFRDVEAGACHYGVVPVENSTEGVVTHTLDMFLNSPLKIVGEVQ